MSAVGGSTGSEPSHASSSSSSRKPTVAETVKPRLVKQGTRATEASSSEEINRIWELRKKGRTGPEWTVHEVTLDNMAEVVVDLQSKHSTDWILYQIPGIETDFALGPPPLAVHERRAKEMLDLLKRIGGDGTKQIYFHRNFADNLGSFDIVDGQVTTMSEQNVLFNFKCSAAVGGVVMVRVFLGVTPPDLVPLPDSEGPNCSMSTCHRKATVECPICVELGVEKTRRQFCSQKCFMKGWKVHSRKRHGEYQCGLCPNWHARDSRAQIRAFRFTGDDGEIRRAAPDKCKELYSIAHRLNARRAGNEQEVVKEPEWNSWIEFL